MATWVHNKRRAVRSRDLILETAEKEAECCIALAYIGKVAQPVALVLPSGLSGLTKKLGSMNYEGDPAKIDVKKDKDFKLIALGLARLDQDKVLNVRLKKGSAKSLQKGLREYFKVGFGIPVPYASIAPEVALPEDQENLFAQSEVENQQKFSGEQEDADEAAAEGEQLPAYEPVADQPVADQPAEDKVPEDAPPAYEPPADEPVTDEPATDEPATDEPPAYQSLPDELKQGIATASATIAGHAISLSRQIGMEQKAELGPLTDKITAWLENMLDGVPPEEREMRLHNLTSRLLLMLAYPENLRNIQYVDEKPATDGDEQGKPDREKVLVNGVDLDSVSTDDLTREEVTQSLFKLAKAEAMKRQLPYPLNQASPDRIAGMVASGWPKEDGDAAGKRTAVQRLVAVIQQMFLKDDQLIGLLGFKKADTAKGDDLVASLVDSIKEVWEAHRNAAIKQKDEVKRRVNQIVKVESLGGTWRYVDDIFLQIDGEISEQLAAIIGQEGEARSKALDAVADTVQTNLGYLDGNNIIDLLDDPPFDVGQGAVGATLREGLSGVSDGLKRIESSMTAAAA